MSSLFWPGANAFISIISGAAGVIAHSNPSSLSRSTTVTKGEIYYQRLYSARAVAWELLVAVLPFYYKGPAVAAVIAASGVVQAADVCIAVSHGEVGMIFGATLATVVHGACVLWALSPES